MQSMSVACALVLVGCATPSMTVERGQANSGTSESKDAVSLGFLNRLTWGADANAWHDASQIGAQRYIERQLQPKDRQELPEAVQSRIAAMTITQRPNDQLVYDLEQRRKDSDAIANDEDKKIAQQAYQRELTRLGNEAATRFLLRALYGRDQLQEQMTWFWMNHFNVHQYKNNLRAMMGDYEERACVRMRLAVSRSAFCHCASSGDAALSRQRAERGRATSTRTMRAN